MGFRRSTVCEAGSCVEVEIRDDTVTVRVAADTFGPRLEFTHDEWAAFVAGVKAGEFDVRVPDVG